MTWENFYLVCFLVGFLLSLLSFVLSHFPFHLHLHGGDGGGPVHLHVGDGAGHVAGHVTGHAIHAGHGDAGHGASEAAVSPVNFGTVAAFLAWFGGSGYLLTRYSSFWTLAGLAVAIGCGLGGAALVFAFLSRLVSPDENLNPLDYEMVGVLGRISSGIREAGTGELVYSQEGTRRTCGARAEGGVAIPKGTEVVVTRYEHGLAYVRTWDELSGEDAPRA